MQTRSGSPVLRRILGKRLRRLRETAGHTLQSAAPRLDWSVSKLSRIETARQLVDVHGVRSMLDLYDVGGDQWTATLELTRQAARRGWWRVHGMGDTSYVGFEAAAEQVQEYSAGLVPGLLQTTGYARALLSTSVVPRTPADLDREVQVRTIRAHRLTDDDDPLRLVVVIDEAALHNPLGGEAVLRSQLDHLVAVADLPRVTVQVLPERSGGHASLSSGFCVLSFGDLDEPDMAYVEHALGAVHLEGPEEVALARRKFDQLRTLALSPADTLALLRRVAAEHEGG